MKHTTTFLLVLLVVVIGASCSRAPADRQILVASKPGEATVTLDDAELGTTPMQLTVAGGETTTVTVSKEGFESQQVALSADTGPNLVVELTALPTPTALPAAAGPRYTTMRQIKIAYREGDISRSQYDEYKREINRRRKVELDQAKADLRAGHLTEGRYKKKVRVIKAKYEG